MQTVVAGIIQKDGKFLIAKRKESKCLGNKWEFPGGKLEPGETFEEALKRELKEELDIETRIGELFFTTQFCCGNINIKLFAYKTTFLSGKIKIVDHDDYCWINVNEFKNYEFVEPDIPIVKNLIKNISNY